MARAHHARETELWLKIHKKDSGVPTVTYAQALDVALCWGWIDGIRKSFDERSFLQRFTPAQGEEHLEPDQPRPHRPADGGGAHDAARPAAGRCGEGGWPLGRRLRADPQRDGEATIPDDLRAAIEANARARRRSRPSDGRTSSRWRFARTT